jgi:hypothetical protein
MLMLWEVIMEDETVAACVGALAAWHFWGGPVKNVILSSAVGPYIIRWFM